MKQGNGKLLTTVNPGIEHESGGSFKRYLERHCLHNISFSVVFYFRVRTLSPYSSPTSPRKKSQRYRRPCRRHHNHPWSVDFGSIQNVSFNRISKVPCCTLDPCLPTLCFYVSFVLVASTLKINIDVVKVTRVKIRLVNKKIRIYSISKMVPKASTEDEQSTFKEKIRILPMP